MVSDSTYIGIDLGGTNIQVGVIRPTAPREVLGAVRAKTKAGEGADAVLARIAEAAEKACAKAGLAVSDAAGLGIGAPGAIEPSSGVVLEAVNLRWRDLPLADRLGGMLNLPVVVDNDVNAALYGEHACGAGQGATDLLGVWAGTGIGGAIMLGGKLYYGQFLTAGEIGHMLLYPMNPRGRRSLEHNCSRTAVVDGIADLLRANEESMIPEMVGGDLNKVRSKILARAYEQEDALTREVVDFAAELLGGHIGSVVTLLSIGRIVLGGGLTEAIGAPFVRRVQEAARKVAFPDKCKSLEVVASELEDDAGLIGAALLAAERLGR